jgi:predicted DNA-binding transcriptional regulator AlpA
MQAHQIKCSEVGRPMGVPWSKDVPFDLMDVKACCAALGGIHAASWYRGIRQGRYPKPVKVGSLSRRLRSEVEVCLARMIEVRQ